MKRGQFLRIQHLNVVIIAIAVGILLMPIMGSGEAGAITLKFSHQFPEKDGFSRAITYLCDLVEKRTDGRVKFQHFYASSLVKSAQAFDSLKAGIADAADCGIGFSTGKVPDFAVLELQAAVPSGKWMQVYKEIEPILGKIFAQHNIKFLEIAQVLDLNPMDSHC